MGATAALPGLIGAGSKLISGATGSPAGAGPSSQDFAAAAFNERQGIIGAQQAAANTGTGNPSSFVQNLNTNQLNAATQFAMLNTEQAAAANAAQNDLQQTIGTAIGSGLFGSQTGNFGNQGTGNLTGV